MPDRPTYSDFQWRRAKREAERIVALLPQLNEESLACVELVTAALLVATKYDVDVVTRLAAAQPLNLAAITDYCRLVVDAHHRQTVGARPLAL